jgi:hypothetical protein
VITHARTVLFSSSRNRHDATGNRPSQIQPSCSTRAVSSSYAHSRNRSRCGSDRRVACGRHANLSRCLLRFDPEKERNRSTETDLRHIPREVASIDLFLFIHRCFTLPLLVPRGLTTRACHASPAGTPSPRYAASSFSIGTSISSGFAAHNRTSSRRAHSPPSPQRSSDRRTERSWR